MSPSELYDSDFFEWTVRNAELLRSGRVTEADLDHIAEEIEDMGKSQRLALMSRLSLLLMHLLKWQFQPEKRGKSWSGTIRVQRAGICKLLKQMPSLRRYLDENLSEAYQDAVLRAAADIGLPEDEFPDTCPFTFEALLDLDYLP